MELSFSSKTPTWFSLARALFEPTDEVRDRDVELLRVHDRHVEEETADFALDSGGLARGHAEQDLEIDSALGAARLREQPGVVYTNYRMNQPILLKKKECA